MPVGAIIGGVASIGGAILGSKSQNKAIDKASDAQAAASKEATALQRDIYNKNVGFQTPYLNTGNAAMAQINALLGLQVPQAAPQAPTPAPTQQGTQQGGQQGGWTGIIGNQAARAWQQRIARGEATINDVPEWIRPRLGGQQGLPANEQQQAAVPTVTQPTAEAAYNQFKNYTGYTNRLNEGLNAINSGYAAKGTLQSGAAMQALQQKAQDYASNEFMNYVGLLGGQQQLGPGAANALAGVGTNYANAAGNIAMQQGNNLANAAIAQGNVNSNMWSGIAGGLGGIAGSIFKGSSFSDEQLKKGIQVVRVRSDGLPVKSWIYRNDPAQRRYEGFVAQDVQKVYPEAVIENFKGTGFLGVNYAKIPAEVAA